MRHDRSHIELRTNKDKKSIWLLVDGKMVKEWTDPAEFNGGGGNIIFSCQPGTFVRISNIKVSKWDGKFDDSAGPAAKTDRTRFNSPMKTRSPAGSNRSRMAKREFSSSYAELNIPLERVEQIDLATAHSEQAKPRPRTCAPTFPKAAV